MYANQVLLFCDYLFCTRFYNSLKFNQKVLDDKKLTNVIGYFRACYRLFCNRCNPKEFFVLRNFILHFNH